MGKLQPLSPISLSVSDIQIGAVELKDSDTDNRTNIKAANTARTTATLVVATQPIDAAGAVLSTSALATAAKQDTLDASVNTLLKPANTLASVTTVATVTNLAQQSGVAITLNTGVRDTGTQRITIATNDLVPISAASLPLPSGAATETTLALIKAKTDNIPAQGQALAAASVPVVLTALQETALTAKGVIYDVELPLVTGLLTADGVQYSTAVDTTTANVDVEVLNVTINPAVLGSNTLTAIEFGLTAEFRAVSTATADLIWKWQARNFNGTWVDLHGAVTETDIGTAFVSRTRQGKFLVQANLNQAKIDMRLLLQCNELNEGRSKVNSASYARLIYV